MLVKFDADDDLAERLKSKTHNSVASKAFHYAAIRFLDVSEENALLRQQIADMRDAISVYRKVISGACDAAALLVEHAGQPDLFTDQRKYDIDAWNDPD